MTSTEGAGLVLLMCGLGALPLICVFGVFMYFVKVVKIFLFL
jgi:hypothetical protein